MDIGTDPDLYRFFLEENDNDPDRVQSYIERITREFEEINNPRSVQDFQLDFLVEAFPNISKERIREVYSSNGSDFEKTYAVLTQQKKKKAQVVFSSSIIAEENYSSEEDAEEEMMEKKKAQQLNDVLPQYSVEFLIRFFSDMGLSIESAYETLINGKYGEDIQDLSKINPYMKISKIDQLYKEFSNDANRLSQYLVDSMSSFNCALEILQNKYPKLPKRVIERTFIENKEDIGATEKSLDNRSNIKAPIPKRTPKKVLKARFTVDLHGNNLMQANQIVNETIRICRGHYIEIEFITGKGLHSVGGESVLKKFLISLFRKNGYSFEAKVASVVLKFSKN